MISLRSNTRLCRRPTMTQLTNCTRWTRHVMTWRRSWRMKLSGIDRCKISCDWRRSQLWSANKSLRRWIGRLSSWKGTWSRWTSRSRLFRGSWIWPRNRWAIRLRRSRTSSARKRRLTSNGQIDSKRRSLTMLRHNKSCWRRSLSWKTKCSMLSQPRSSWTPQIARSKCCRSRQSSFSTK